MRTPHPDPETEAWIQRQLATAPPLSPEQRREIAADVAAWRKRETLRRLEGDQQQGAKSA